MIPLILQIDCALWKMYVGLVDFMGKNRTSGLGVS
jgi:hypothetical protein